MASSSRGGIDKHSSSEVTSARSKLDGVLQTLMEKTDDSPEVSEDEVKFSPEINIRDMTQPTSPSKKLPGMKTPRKRRRKDDGMHRDMGPNNYSYVTKLFDRSVDLAPFGEDTPLYPVCRAWMHNEPYASKTNPSASEQLLPTTTSPSADDRELNRMNDIYKLPQPLRMPKSEEGGFKDVRIPSPLPPPEEKLDINADMDKAPSRELLLSNHMVRWKNIRQKWKKASFANEARYKESLTLIKAMKTVFE